MSSTWIPAVESRLLNKLHCAASFVHPNSDKFTKYKEAMAIHLRHERRVGRMADQYLRVAPTGNFCLLATFPPSSLSDRDWRSAVFFYGDVFIGSPPGTGSDTTAAAVVAK